MDETEYIEPTDTTDIPVDDSINNSYKSTDNFDLLIGDGNGGRGMDLLDINLYTSGQGSVTGDVDRRDGQGGRPAS